MEVLTIKDYDLRNSYDFERKLLLFAGFYPRKSSKFEKLYLFSAFIHLIISYGQLLTMIIQMVMDRNNLSKLTETLLYFFTHFTFLMKLLNFEYNKKKLLEIEDKLEDSALYGFSFNQMNIIKKKIASCDRIAYTFRFLCTCTITLYTLAPYIDETKKGNLPLPGWFPYDTDKYYFITVFLQVVSVIISAYCNTCIDIITWKLISIVAAQCEILKENLTKIDHNSVESAKINFIKCIDHHKRIVNLAKQIQNVFSKGMFMQFFGSVIVICTTGFQMIMVPFPSIQFGFCCTYISGMTCQVGTYCWYGNDIITTSDKISESVYMSNWYETDRNLQKILMIFLEKTKKPIIIKAGNFISLSLSTFTQIMRSSYSYFAVLQRLYKDTM